MTRPYSPAGAGALGGTIAYHDATCTNAVESLCACAVNLYKAMIYNQTATVVFFNMYDTTGTVTPGSTAVTRQIPVPPSGAAVVDYDPACFQYGLQYNVSTAVNGSGAPASAVYVDFEYYK
jgi:hypothetical protein